MAPDGVPAAYYLLPPERLLPASSLTSWLGRIVKSHAEPEASFTPSDPSRFITDPPLTTTLTNVVVSSHGATHASLGAFLGATTAQIQGNRELSTNHSFSSRAVKCVRLQDHDGIFRKLRNDREVHSALLEMLPPGGRAGFMIVSVLIWHDAVFSRSWATSKGYSTGAGLPVAASITGATGVPIPPDVIDPRVGVERGVAEAREISGESPGSHIFAIRYKAVRRPLLGGLLGRSNLVLEERGPRVPPTERFGDRDDEDGTEGPKVQGLAAQVEMDEEEVEWADVLDDDDDLERVEAEIQGEEVQFVFDAEKVQQEAEKV